MEIWTILNWALVTGGFIAALAVLIYGIHYISIKARFKKRPDLKYYYDSMSLDNVVVSGQEAIFQSGKGNTKSIMKFTETYSYGGGKSYDIELYVIDSLSDEKMVISIPRSIRSTFSDKASDLLSQLEKLKEQKKISNQIRMHDLMDKDWTAIVSEQTYERIKDDLDEAVELNNSQYYVAFKGKKEYTKYTLMV